jgi:metal-responsive CopG/Arc/MetJ family transcriptional regulator
MKSEKTEKKRGCNKNNSGTHTQLTVRFPNELLDRIKTFAEAERRSRSNAIEHLLWQAVKEKR